MNVGGRGKVVGVGGDEGRITEGECDWCVKGGKGESNRCMNSGVWDERLSSENKKMNGKRTEIRSNLLPRLETVSLTSLIQLALHICDFNEKPSRYEFIVTSGVNYRKIASRSSLRTT
jgi:hypothetical protein